MWVLCMALGVIMVVGCKKKDPGAQAGGPRTLEAKPKIAVLLPEKYNTPDGMVLAPDGNIYLNIPNFSDSNYPAKVLKIDQQDQISEVVTLPARSDTGKVGPLGIEIGPEGNLYVADNQSMFGANDYKSRLLRVNMKDGKAVGCDVLVTGFIQANAVSYHDGSIYVTETSLDLEADPMPSGVYRFALSEFKGEPIRLKPAAADEHLLLKFTTASKDWRVGANGLGFDAKGNLYVCNFGEASLLRYKLDAQGKAGAPEVVAKGDGMKSTDGLKIDPETGDIYIADFVGNAVHRVSPTTGKVTTVWQNEDNSGGVGGLLDRPSEVCLRGNKIYVANIDLALTGNEYDAPHTISAIERE